MKSIIAILFVLLMATSSYAANKTYAEVRDGKVITFMTIPDTSPKPEAAPPTKFVEVTALPEKPKPGDVYDGSKFTQAPVVVEEPVAPVKTLEQKVDDLQKAVDAIAAKLEVK